MSTPAPPSTATTAVQPVEEAPVAVPDDDASMSSDDIKALSRTFTTPDGVPITIMKKPSAESAYLHGFSTTGKVAHSDSDNSRQKAKHHSQRH